jgi:hypothetical protein
VGRNNFGTRRMCETRNAIRSWVITCHDNTSRYQQQEPEHATTSSHRVLRATHWGANNA